MDTGSVSIGLLKIKWIQKEKAWSHSPDRITYMKQNTLQQLREKLGLSLQDLADYTGVSRSLVHLDEPGERKLPLAAFALFTQLLWLSMKQKEARQQLESTGHYTQIALKLKIAGLQANLHEAHTLLITLTGKDQSKEAGQRRRDTRKIAAGEGQVEKVS